MSWVVVIPVCEYHKVPCSLTLVLLSYLMFPCFEETNEEDGRNSEAAAERAPLLSVGYGSLSERTDALRQSANEECVEEVPSVKRDPDAYRRRIISDARRSEFSAVSFLYCDHLMWRTSKFLSAPGGARTQMGATTVHSRDVEKIRCDILTI